MLLPGKHADSQALQRRYDHHRGFDEAIPTRQDLETDRESGRSADLAHSKAEESFELWVIADVIQSHDSFWARNSPGSKLRHGRLVKVARRVTGASHVEDSHDLFQPSECILHASGVDKAER